MDILWLMCGIAVVAVGLLMMIGGSTTRSLDDLYARRAREKAATLGTMAGQEAQGSSTTVGRHRSEALTVTSTSTDPLASRPARAS